MSGPFTFDLDAPPELIRDGEYARCPGDHPCRGFIRDNYRWHHEISRWRRADTFPAGYWDDASGDDGDEGEEVPGDYFDIYEDTDVKVVGRIEVRRK